MTDHAVQDLWHEFLETDEKQATKPSETCRSLRSSKVYEQTFSRYVQKAIRSVASDGSKILEWDEIEAFFSKPSPRPESSSSLKLDFEPGEIELRQEIARGGMGVIYRAHQGVLKREIAIKTVLPGRQLESRFLAEALVVSHLEHPNIVPIHDLLKLSEGSHALAMKLVGGTSWQALLKPQTPEEKARSETYDLDAHLEILDKVSSAVDFAHSKGIIHNDLKPENIMIGEFGEVLVMDWGTALRFRELHSALDAVPHAADLQGSILGTPVYMPPELARGQTQEIGPATDVYLLGAILYEILSGVPPHDGPSLFVVLAKATRSQPDPLPPEAPPELVRLCFRALAPNLQERFPSVKEFQEGLRSFLKHQESLAITDSANDLYQQAESLLSRLPPSSLPSPSSQPATSLHRVYGLLIEAIALCSQAQILWKGNLEARLGEREARQKLADVALTHGDLGIASLQIEALPPKDFETGELKNRLLDAEEAILRRQRKTIFLSHLTTVLLLLLFLALTGGSALLYHQRKVAEGHTEQIQQQIAGIRRLSDLKLLSDLREEAASLWPTLPSKVPDLLAWLDQAQALRSRLPEHQRSLHDLRKTDGDLRAERWTFPTPRLQRRHDTLVSLVTGLQDFEKTAIRSVERRLRLARKVREESIEQHRETWKKAILSIQDPKRSPKYRGLQIQPQLGLIPIGKDPLSGLWEFAHLLTGEPAYRNDGGRLELTEDTGVVLVLLPRGTFLMGAQRPLSKEASKPNLDPHALPHEGPIHSISLEPFFLSKYELTQAQWLRFHGSNPSAYQPGRVVGGHKHTLLHPVEQVSWAESLRVLGRMDLHLPTEAQWEYAVRAGTHSVWWTGDLKDSLQGAGNLADRFCRDNGGPASWRYESSLYDGFLAHAPIGRFRPNPFGLHDMVGNVWEWCFDSFASYLEPTQPGTGLRLPAKTEARSHVFRGGGFRSSAIHARSADRYPLYSPLYQAYDVGIRPARPLRSE